MTPADAVSLLRVLLALVFVAFFATKPGWQLDLCVGVAILAQVTDHIDGFLARRSGYASEVGWLVDSGSDRAFYIAALLAFERAYGLSLVLVWLFILREIALYATKIATREFKHYREGAFVHAALTRVGILFGCLVPYGWFGRELETKATLIITALIIAATISAYAHLALMIRWWRKSAARLDTRRE